MRCNNYKYRFATGSMLAMAVAVCGVGCSSSTSTSHVKTPPAAVSPHALASADGSVVFTQPFSLVAADSIGLATFGAEIAAEEQSPAKQRLAVER